MSKLSAFVITRNNSHTIERAINSIKTVAEEIIIVDIGSIDDTVQIAKSLGAHVVSDEHHRLVKQKSYVERFCKNDWIINIDANEELSQDLQDEIKFIFGSKFQGRYSAYKMKVITLHCSDAEPRFMAPFNESIKIYNKQYCSYKNCLDFNIKNSVSFNDQANSKVYLLNGIAYHHLGLSINQMLNKENFYSLTQDEYILDSKCYISTWRVALEFPLSFFKNFFKKRYFVFGFDGFIYSMIFAFARFLQMAKAKKNKQQYLDSPDNKS